MYFVKYINNILNLNINLKINSNLDISSRIEENYAKINSDIETGNFEFDENYDIECGIYKNISNYLSMLNNNHS